MVKTFRQFLEEKVRLTELAAGATIDAQTQNAIIAQLVGAQQGNNVNNIADNLSKRNPALTLAVMNSPAAEMLQAKNRALQKKTQPQQQQNLNTNINTLGALPGTQI
jgi:hypothetical protein